MASIATDASSYIPAAPILIPEGPWEQVTAIYVLSIPTRKYLHVGQLFSSCIYVFLIYLHFSIKLNIKNKVDAMNLNIKVVL